MVPAGASVAVVMVGCPNCLPADAQQAWDGFRDLVEVAVPIDEPHHRVTILSCARCRQRYVAVFTETVDWAAGEDPQHRTVMAITADEAEALAAHAAASDLESLPQRRSLVVDHPTGTATATARWSHGIVVPHHD